MTTDCPTCGQSIGGLTAEMVDKLIDWDDVHFLCKGQSEDFDDLTVKKVVDVEGSSYDSYGEVVQGDVFMVVEINGRLFKKDGYRDSYGGTTWEGDCREVSGKPRTITVFDYV